MRFIRCGKRAGVTARLTGSASDVGFSDIGPGYGILLLTEQRCGIGALWPKIDALGFSLCLINLPSRRNKPLPSGTVRRGKSYIYDTMDKGIWPSGGEGIHVVILKRVIYNIICFNSNSVINDITNKIHERATPSSSSAIRLLKSI